MSANPFLNLKRALELATSIEAATKKEPEGSGTHIDIQDGDWELIVHGLRRIALVLEGTRASAIDFQSFDYSKKEDMVRLGKELGAACLADIAPLIKGLKMECRIVFLASWISVSAGHMKAAIGKEATLAIIDGVRLIVDGDQRDRRRDN